MEHGDFNPAHTLKTLGASGVKAAYYNLNEAGLMQQAVILALQFGHFFTAATDEKLRGALMARMLAGNEGITAFDAMYQALGEQKFQRAVNNRWRDALLRMATIQFGKYVVGTQRLVAAEQNFEHFATPRGQPQLAGFAKLARLGEQLALAATVVVLAKSETG